MCRSWCRAASHASSSPYVFTIPCVSSSSSYLSMTPIANYTHVIGHYRPRSLRFIGLSLYSEWHKFVEPTAATPTPIPLTSESTVSTTATTLSLASAAWRGIPQLHHLVYHLPTAVSRDDDGASYAELVRVLSSATQLRTLHITPRADYEYPHAAMTIIGNRLITEGLLPRTLQSLALDWVTLDAFQLQPSSPSTRVLPASLTYLQLKSDSWLNWAAFCSVVSATPNLVEVRHTYSTMSLVIAYACGSCVMIIGSSTHVYG